MGYLVTLLLSGPIVRHFVGTGPKIQNGSKGNVKEEPYDVGAIIGKCENILTITFILAGELTGLAIIFTAKSLIRKEDIRKDTRYYLGGTLINFTFSVIIGYFIKLAIR
jgi:hypothetical protein